MGREFPDNGFVDDAGRLTDAGRDAVLRFWALYQNPLAFLAERWGEVYRAVLALIASRRLTQADFDGWVWVMACRYVRRFDPAKGTDVAKTFLPMSIGHAARRVLDEYRMSVRPSQFPMVTAKDGDREEWEPVAKSRPVGWELAAADEVSRVKSVVSPAQWQAMSGRHMDGRTGADVAAEMGIARQRVDQLCEEGAAKVRRRVNARRECG